MLNKAIRLAVPLAMIALPFTAAAESAGTVKVGVQSAQTGAASFYGAPAVEGIQLTVKKINDMGGLKIGDKNYKVELVVRDDGSSPETARAIVQQLITEEKVDVLIAGVFTNIVAAVLPIAERYGVPAVATFAYSPKVMPENPKYTFNNVMTTVDQFEAPLELFRKIGVKSVALVGTNDDLGEGFVLAMPEILKKGGFELAGVERIEANTTNFAPTMARLKRLKADALLVYAGQPLSYHFRTAQAQYDACTTFKASVYGFGPTLQPAWVNSTATAGVGALGQGFWWPTMKGGLDPWFEGNENFVKEYQAAYGKVPVWGAAQGVQAMQVMALALQTAGSLDKDAIAAAFPKIKGSTIYGPVRYDSDHFNRGFVHQQLVIQQQGPNHADTKIVFPPSNAEAEYQPDTCGKS